MLLRSKLGSHNVTRREGNERVPAAEANLPGRTTSNKPPQNRREQETVKKFQATIQRLNEAIQKQDTGHPLFQFLVKDFDAISDVVNMAQKLEKFIKEFQ